MKMEAKFKKWGSIVNDQVKKLKAAGKLSVNDGGQYSLFLKCWKNLERFTHLYNLKVKWNFERAITTGYLFEPESIKRYSFKKKERIFSIINKIPGKDFTVLPDYENTRSDKSKKTILLPIHMFLKIDDYIENLPAKEKHKLKVVQTPESYSMAVSTANPVILDDRLQDLEEIPLPTNTPTDSYCESQGSGQNPSSYFPQSFSCPSMPPQSPKQPLKHNKDRFVQCPVMKAASPDVATASPEANSPSLEANSPSLEANSPSPPAKVATPLDKKNENTEEIVENAKQLKKRTACKKMCIVS